MLLRGVTLVGATFSISPEEVLGWRWRRFLAWLALATEHLVEIRQLQAVATGEAFGLAWAKPEALLTLLPDSLRDIAGTVGPSPPKFDAKAEAKRGLEAAERVLKAARIDRRQREAAERGE